MKNDWHIKCIRRRHLHMFKAHGRCKPPNVHLTHLILTTHLMRLSTPTPINRDSGFFFFLLLYFISSALLQTSLPKEPLETLDASTTFDFSISVCNSNLFRVVGFLECLRDLRCSISFRKGFWFTSFRFYPWWVMKSPGEISFSFRWFFLSSFLIFSLWTSG